MPSYVECIWACGSWDDPQSSLLYLHTLLLHTTWSREYMWKEWWGGDTWVRYIIKAGAHSSLTDLSQCNIEMSRLRTAPDEHSSLREWTTSPTCYLRLLLSWVVIRCPWPMRPVVQIFTDNFFSSLLVPTGIAHSSKFEKGRKIIFLF